MANRVNIDKLRLAFLGVSHWHMVLFAPAIKSYGLNVVAVSDSDPAIAGAYAGEFKCKTYADPKTLMEQERPDFVFAFDVHADMAALCKTIISEGIAFSMEKPLGINAAEVREVKELAEKNGVFCSIPFIWRYSTLMRDIKEKTSAEDFYNLSFNFICGPPSRYTDTSPWLLQNAKAGGGCMTNLGVHFMDMGYWLTESDDAEVLSAGYHYINGYDVEDYATASIRMSSGCTLAIQTGYAYPMDETSKRDNHWNFAARQGYYTLSDGQMETRLFGRPTHIEQVCTDADLYYPLYVAATLGEYVADKPPSASLRDMLRARQMLDRIIEKAKR